MNFIEGLSLQISYINKYPFIIPNNYDYQSRIYPIRSCIYLLKFSNNKIYIGSAINLKNRIKGHRTDLLKNKHCNNIIQKFYNKYGIENIEIYTLEENILKEETLIKEQYYLDLYKSYDKKIGYNICKKAGSKLGFKSSKETCEKISKALTGKTLSKEHSNKVSKNRIGKIGLLSNNPRLKSIIKINKISDEIISEYACISDALRSLNLDNTNSSIGNCLSGRSKTAHGFKWKYRTI